MAPLVLVAADDSIHPAPRLGEVCAPDDPAARRLLRRAQGALQKWPEGFRGFRARVRCEIPGACAGGEVEAGPHGVEVSCSDPALRRLVSDMLRAVILERTPRFFEEGDGRFPISWGAASENADGPVIAVHLGHGRRDYWLDGKGRIQRVEQVANGVRIRVDLMAYARATPGRVLPARTVTTVWDVASGAVLSAEAVEDNHCRVNHVWLPQMRRITGRDGGAPAVLYYDQHQLI